MPFLFDIVAARQLLDAAAAPPDNPKATGRGATYHATFALCYGLGLRAGEVCGLRLGDVDTGRGLLVVRGGKFGKSRLVPHGPRISELLAHQVQRRGGYGDGPLFSFDAAHSVHPGSASQTFHRLVAELGFPVPDGVAPPRLHCLRHSFAVGCLLRWYREGLDPQSRLYQLSTFMGHVDPASNAALPDDHAPISRRGQPAVRSVRPTGVVAGKVMTGPRPLGPLIHSFFLDHLATVKGLWAASMRSYRDTIRLLLCFIAQDKKTKITKLTIEDLTFERLLGFLRYLENDRDNHVRTRNQRLAALHTLFDYIASREPEMLEVCQRVAAIPMKRAAPAETHFLERDEVQALLRGLPRTGRHALRDRALLVFLYNTGARAQEVADLRVGHLELGEAPVVRLHGKGDKGRTCPLWRQTTPLLAELIDSPNAAPSATAPVFCSATGEALTPRGR